MSFPDRDKEPPLLASAISCPRPRQQVGCNGAGPVVVTAVTAKKIIGGGGSRPNQCPYFQQQVLICPTLPYHGRQSSKSLLTMIAPANTSESFTHVRSIILYIASARQAGYLVNLQPRLLRETCLSCMRRHEASRLLVLSLSSSAYFTITFIPAHARVRTPARSRLGV